MTSFWRAVLQLVPEAIRAIGSLVRKAQQPKITYGRTSEGRWIARHKGRQAIADTRDEAARRVVLEATRAELEQ